MVSKIKPDHQLGFLMLKLRKLASWLAEGFQVTVFTLDRRNEDIRVNERVNEGVNEGVNELYYFIKDFSGNRTPYYSQVMNVPEKTIERWLKQLRQENKVEFKGAPKTGGYFIKLSSKED